MRPSNAGVFWVRRYASEEWSAMALVAGEAPFLRVLAVMDLTNGRRLAEYDIAEWGPEIIQPEYEENP